MSASTVFRFLKENTDMKGNDTAIKEALQQMDVDSWYSGYQERCKQQRKMKLLAEVRRNGAVKKLLDYLSDLTHGGEVDKKSK